MTPEPTPPSLPPGIYCTTARLRWATLGMLAVGIYAGLVLRLLDWPILTVLVGMCALVLVAVSSLQLARLNARERRTYEQHGVPIWQALLFWRRGIGFRDWHHFNATDGTGIQVSRQTTRLFGIQFPGGPRVSVGCWWALSLELLCIPRRRFLLEATTEATTEVATEVATEEDRDQV